MSRTLTQEKDVLLQLKCAHCCSNTPAFQNESIYVCCCSGSHEPMHLWRSSRYLQRTSHVNEPHLSVLTLSPFLAEEHGRAAVHAGRRLLRGRRGGGAAGTPRRGRGRSGGRVARVLPARRARRTWRLGLLHVCIKFIVFNSVFTSICAALGKQNGSDTQR